MALTESMRVFGRCNGLVVLALATAVTLLACAANAGETEKLDEAGGLILLGLNYQFNAFEPIIDAETMQLHWGRHHRAYTDNVNAALRTISKDQNVSPRLRQASQSALANNEEELKEAIKSAVEEEPRMPVATRKALRSIRNNGGGFANHNEFWENIAPPNQGGGGEPEGSLAAALVTRFGSIDAFREKFVQEGLGVFGSGWVWLVLTPDVKLEIITTPNQDRPLDGSKVIIACDVWEHAYYLKYNNRRQEYLANFWSVVNYKVAQERYEKALRECQA